MLRLLIFIFLFSFSYNLLAQNTTITGTITDASTSEPLQEVEVKVLNSTLATTSNVQGQYSINELTPGTYAIVFSKIGFESITRYNIIVGSGNNVEISVELNRKAKLSKTAVVSATKKDKSAKAASLETPLSVQRITSEEIKANPGGNFDISKVINTLPGVGGSPGGTANRNDIIIRGGAPNENVYYLDGIEIPVLNHFQTQGSSGGPQGILNVSFIEDVKLSSSAFDARYDNALSSVFQVKQKNGSSKRIQGNFRLSASEAALTTEGPIGKQTTFIASARRSYLRFLFEAIDIPIRPDYWDFQTKITHRLNSKTTLSFVGVGAIDEFSLGKTKKSSPENSQIAKSVPLINQWNYTGGIAIKHQIRNGFWNLAISRNQFANDIKRYEDNEKVNSPIVLDYNSSETENKIRFDVNKTINDWKIAYGLMGQYVQYTNTTLNKISNEIKDTAGNIIVPAIVINFNSPLQSFFKYGAFGQVGKRFLQNKLGISAGIRTDMNSFTTDGRNPLATLSPRLSASYMLVDKLTFNASIGRYFKLSPYTVLGYAENGILQHKDAKYTRSNHYTAGFEYMPSGDLRFTLEGFYKQYNNVPITVQDGISLSNLGADFSTLGNERVTFDGKGRAWGFELFTQKKLTKRCFSIVSYTYFKSEYTNRDGKYTRSAWDNRHLLSMVWGYEFKRNWELGLKFRLQGGSPYSPFDSLKSLARFWYTGSGIYDFSRLNTLSLNTFNSSDVRIDKKWNFKKTTLDIYMDIQNWYAAKNKSLPTYYWKRKPDNSDFATTDGLPIKQDGSNAIPILLPDNFSIVLPTIGFIVEF